MLVRRIRSRGANITVEAHGEVLFAPGTELSRWKNTFSQRIRAATAEAAPSNKRPRWGHYGKPLKSTFTASTTTRITRGGGFFYIAVGSSAPYAMYVDQGTGVHAGKSPWEAKVLPPWQQGSASLYENTWRPAGPGTRRVSPVMIQGQRGQFFFAQGLKRGFQSMRLRSFQVPGEGVSGMRSAMATFPDQLANFVGNTPADAAFQLSLEEWRSWRDEAWNNHEGLGRGGGIGSRAQQRFRDRAAAAAEARAAAQGKGRAAYLASKAAAQARAKAQRDALRQQREAKARGEKRRAEQEAKDAADRAKANAAKSLAKGNAQKRRQAIEFFSLIKKQYPDVQYGETSLPGGVTMYWVRYTVGGERVTQRWAYGYDDA